MSESISVEVVYAHPAEQVIFSLDAAELGITVEQAIQRSGVLERYPEIDLSINKVGIFGKLTKLSENLKQGDRIEIYRPLIADPKAVRKQKAEAEKNKNK